MIRGVSNPQLKKRLRPDDGRGKNRQLCLRQLPGIRRHVELFGTEPLQQLLAVPAGFSSHLWQKNPASPVDGYLNPVKARLKIRRIGDRMLNSIVNCGNSDNVTGRLANRGSPSALIAVSRTVFMSDCPLSILPTQPRNS